MNCSACGCDNPQPARFCMQCGQPLDEVCPGCGGDLPPDALVCIQCGRRVRESTGSADSGPDAPSEDAVAAQRGERRNVTVVFSDLTGYTALNERLDPEEVETIMDRIKARAVSVIERHGGIVNQFVGDEVLALFGIPVAHEDDPLRAVRAALELHEFVDGVSGEVAERIGQALGMHTGIHTGLVLLRLRDPRSGNYSITGDAVNTAARLVSQAGSGELVVSPETRRLIAPYYECEPLTAVELKGKALPVTPYRVKGASDVRNRFEAARRQGLRPYLGNGAEVARLQEALEAALNGHGQIVTITGEAGLGKSRLIWEFQRQSRERPLSWLQGICNAFGAETPYLPFIEAMREDLGLGAPATTDALRAKVILAVSEREGLATYLPFFLHLLSLPDPNHPLPPNLAGQELAGAFSEAVSAWLLHCAATNPSVLVLEDWHWADEASRAVLQRLIPRIGQAALAVVVSYRSELRIDWGPHPHHQHLALRALGASETAALIRSVLGGRAVPPELAQRIYERTGGNPLFVEETTSALLEEGVLAIRGDRVEAHRELDGLELPGTIQAVIRSRLDRLERHDRDTLGLASVIGQEFAYSLLERLSPAPERLAASLATLQESDLLLPLGTVPEPTYAFKQQLTQQVAYETQLRERRRELHGLVARAIEALHPDRLDEQVELLLHHTALAEDWCKAGQLAHRAGKKAHGLSHYLQAARDFELGVGYLLHLPDDPEQRLQRVDLQLEAGFCYINLGQFAQAIQAGEGIEQDAETLADARRRMRLWIMLGTAWMYLGNRERCEHYLLQAVAMPELQGDALTAANCKQLLAGCYLGQGLWNLAAPYLEEAIAIYEQEDAQEEYLYGYFVLPYLAGCAQLALVWALLGRVQEASDLFRRTLPLAMGGVANFASKGIYFSWLSVFTGLVGEDRLGIQPAVEAMVKKAEGSGSPFLLLAGRVVQTNLLVALERFEEARTLAGQAVAALAGKPIRTGHVANLYYNLILPEIRLGHTEAARKHLVEARPLESLSPHWFGPRFDFLAALLADLGEEQAEAQALFDRSIAGDEEAGAHVLADQTRYHRALAQVRAGQDEPAGRELEALRLRFAARGMPGWALRCARALKKEGPAATSASPP